MNDRDKSRSSLLASRFSILWLPWKGTRAEKLLRLVPSLVYMAAIFQASSLSSDQLPVPAGVSDLLLHFVAYFGLGLSLLFSAAAFARERLSARESWTAGAIGILYGATDEWHQSFVPGRSATLIDLVFDACGLMAAVLLIHLLLRKTRPA